MYSVLLDVPIATSTKSIITKLMCTNGIYTEAVYIVCICSRVQLHMYILLKTGNHIVTTIITVTRGSHLWVVKHTLQCYRPFIRQYLYLDHYQHFLVH